MSASARPAEKVEGGALTPTAGGVLDAKKKTTKAAKRQAKSQT
jgi:hypothetical protein